MSDVLEMPDRSSAANGCECEPGPIVIVAGFLRCGMATTMAMLEAGGMPIAGGAHPPTYELPETAHKVDDFVRDVLGGYDPRLVTKIMKEIPAPLLKIGAEISPTWFAGLRGQAVKFVNPHLMACIPPGAHRAIWLDRDEQERCRSWCRYVGAPETGLMVDIFANYFTARRSAARDALKNSGAIILDVQHAELTGGAQRCRAVVDSIVDFVGLPLDRDAMVKRAESAIL